MGGLRSQLARRVPAGSTQGITKETVQGTTRTGSWIGNESKQDLRGATDRAIAHQSRHRSLATLGGYVRIHNAWTDNAATSLGL